MTRKTERKESHLSRTEVVLTFLWVGILLLAVVGYELYPDSIFGSMWTAPLGVLVGHLLAPLFVHWLALFVEAVRMPPLGEYEAKPRAISKIGLIIALVNPIPWAILIGCPYAIVVLLHKPEHAEWLWFIAAAFVTFSVIMIYGLGVALCRGRSTDDAIHPPE